MKQTSKKQKNLLRNEKIDDSDLVQEVNFEIDKNAFKSPIKCHGNTVLLNKKVSYNNLDFTYETWKCTKCNKEYLDTLQAQKLERFWMIEKLLENKTINIERTMNYDGKAYFFRFPKELTKGWIKGSLVDIKLITPENNIFLIEIKRPTNV